MATQGPMIFLHNGNAATDAEFEAEMNRRRVHRLLSTSFFICFLILFLSSSPKRNHNRYSPATSPTEIPLDVVNQMNNLHHWMDKEQHEKKQKKEVATTNATMILPSKEYNVTGVFSGQWTHVDQKAYEDRISIERNTRLVHPSILSDVGISPDAVSKTMSSKGTSGVLWLLLQSAKSNEDELALDISYVTGHAILHDTTSSFAATVFSVQGVLMRKTGELTLYGNYPQSVVQLNYPANATLNANHTSSGSSAFSNAPDGSINYNVSPPRYQRPSRFRPETGGVSQLCFYEMNVQLEGKDTMTTETGKKIQVNSLLESDKPKFEGVLASENCGLYMNVNAVYKEADLSSFYDKAGDYAILMTIVCMAQIYLLLVQFKYSITPAAISKVSLLAIGLQAILDSYLCLLHLTGGIMAQSIFTTFATVSFFKLILFSIFEMRFILMIWKARRPQSFAEGWESMRRELTVLYSRFYGSMILGLFLMYNAWNHINVIVLIGYSFWVPQIIHNVHQEARYPLCRNYLYGISASRLFVPLYIYGYPGNFIASFPMYTYTTNYGMCIALILWMGIQVTVLVLQDIYGPRFFVPARFLPTKYDYSRPMAPEQLSLLKRQASSDDTLEGLDCVICMAELELDDKDYMIAPCDHVFHKICLSEWMEVKMECPTCRSVLPIP